MKVSIYLNEGNHNPINLDGTLIEFTVGSKGSTLVMSGGENNKKLRGLFAEIRGKENVKSMGLIKEAICVLNEEGTETLYFPAQIKIHAI